MSTVEGFLSKNEEQEIIAAIQVAEKNTSGEIRIHIEAVAKKDHYSRAIEVFHLLHMDATRLRNGVLIYVAVNDKKFVIYGDIGINNVVAPDFWNSTKDSIQSEFKQNNFKQGIINGVLKAGNELKVHFPYQKEDDDELSNEISKG